MGMEQKEFEECLSGVCKGDWRAYDKLFDYFREDKSEQGNQRKQAAFQFFTTPNNANNPYLMVFVGIMYRRGWGVQKDELRVVNLYRTAAEKYKNSWGQLCLSQRYKLGDLVTKNEKEACRLTQLAAADINFPEAQVELAYYYRNGLGGLVKNPNETFRLYKQAAEKHSYPDALYQLGECYILGIGTSKNPNEALRYYRLAANVGSSSGQYAIYWMYKNHPQTGVSQDEGDKNLRLAVLKDNTNALNQLLGPKGMNAVTCNPFNHYIPVNRDLTYKVVANKTTHVSVHDGSGGSYQTTDSFTIAVEYTGPTDIGNRAIITRMMPNYYSEEVEKKRKAVILYVNEKELQECGRKANERYSQTVAEVIREADALITQRLTEVKRIEQEALKAIAAARATPQQIPVAQPGTVNITMEQLQQMLEVAALKGAQQAQAAAVPQQPPQAAPAGAGTFFGDSQQATTTATTSPLPPRANAAFSPAPGM
jgi:TPR repeat protein